MAVAIKGRTRKGRFRKIRRPSVLQDYNDEIFHVCDSFNGCDECCPGISKPLNSKKISMDGWQHGSRITEFGVLVKGLHQMSPWTVVFSRQIN